MSKATAAGTAGRVREGFVLRTRTSAASWPRTAVWIVASLTALALALRWACVHQSIFGDELILYSIVHHHSLGDVMSVVHDSEKTPPLGFLLVWLLDQGSDDTVWFRLPSLAASVATVPLIYLLGLRTVGRGAGLVAAAWFALSPFQMFYGTEARGYALVTALVVMATLSLLAALDERRLRWWALYALAATAAVYTHYIAALVLVPQAAWALWSNRDSAREQLCAHAVVVLAFLPWLPSFLVQAGNSSDEAKRIYVLSPVTLNNVIKESVSALVGRPDVAPRELPGTIPLAVLAALGLGLSVALGYRYLARRETFKPTLATRSGLLGVLALSPVIVIVLDGMQPRTSFLLSRNLIVAVPYALLLFGRLLTFPRPRLTLVLSAIALVSVGVGTVKMLSPSYQRPDSRAAARYIDSHAGPYVPVINSRVAQATKSYLRRPHPVYVAGKTPPAVWTAAARSRSPIFFSSLDAPVLLFTPPARYAPNYRLVASRTWPGVPFPITVREFAPR